MTLRRLAVGLLIFPAWLVVIFVISLFFDPDEYPPLGGGMVAAILMTAITWFLASNVTLSDPKAAPALGFSWVAVFVAFQLLVTIPNGTVDVVFGTLTTYLTYVGIVAAVILASWRRSPSVPAP